jgi:hypothetical protein
MKDRPGCLSGLLKLAFLNWIFDWLQERFGFGRGLSCTPDAVVGSFYFSSSWRSPAPSSQALTGSN